MQRITIEPAGNLDALGHRWRALERDADPGFFRSWTFLGCLAASRFAKARLLSVKDDGVDMVLALLGGERGRAWLNETGLTDQDAPFIEHNGLLIRRSHAPLAAIALRAAARATGRLTLAGIDDATLAAARRAGWLHLAQSRFAPSVRLGAPGADFLATLSANTRAQIRRAMRLYGPGLQLRRADTQDQALAWFHELVSLHQTSWVRRGKPGAFATPMMQTFHAALIARAWPLGEADLLKISAGARTVGLLYNFVRDGRVLSYQSGFAYDPAEPHAKPGLVCHALAIAHYQQHNAVAYDLLAGADRYKRSLTRDGEALHWATLYPPGSLRGATHILATAARRHLNGSNYHHQV